jgi:hypothetical protein
MNFVKKIIFSLLLLFATTSIANGQSKWSVNSSLQYASGNYLSTERLNSYYLYGSIRYESDNYSLALSIPLIASNGQNVSQFGQIYLPNHMGSGTTGMGGQPTHGGHMMGNQSFITTTSSENFGIGDLYLYANYNLLDQFSSVIGLGFSSYVKFPTASTTNGFGTGKFDFSLSTALRKNFDSFLIYASGGYIFLGNPDSVKFINPFTFNIGIGKVFGDGNLSALLSYSLYSKILDVYEMPQELSFGINIISNSKITYTLIGSAGLSNSTPDYVLSFGIKYNLAD